MTFIQLHKLCSYLLAGTGFLSLLLPNELHPITWFVVSVAVFWSWYMEPPRIQELRYRRFWTWSTVGFVFGMIGIGVVGIFPNPILIGCYLLIILQINKLFNRHAHRDFLQIYVLSFLMLTLGTILNNDLSYALTFLLYVIFVTWTLTLFHLRREIEGTYLMRHSEDLQEGEKVDVSQILQSRRLIKGSFLGAISVIALVIFTLSSVLFFLFPRIGFGLFFQRKRGGTSVSGFSNKVDLGSFGRIRLNRTVVMRIELPDQKKPVLRLPYYWRGMAYDLYDGRSWKRSRTLNKLTRFFPPEQHQVTEVKDNDEDKVIKQVIYQEPLDVSLLFGMDQVYAVQIPMNIPTRVRHMVPRVERDLFSDSLSYQNVMTSGSSLRYVAYSIPERPRPLSLQPRAAEQYFKPMFLQLPDSLDPRIRVLARQITQRASSWSEKVRAVQTHLQNNYTYSLERSEPKGSPLADFLFVQKKGHCEYFSTAMAILLRTLNIPTRQVTGFYTASWNAYGKYYVVRQSDAHAWVEVYFPKVGWQRFDPSPSAPSSQRNRFLSMVEEYFDSLRLAWYKWIIEYDLENQLAFLRTLRERMSLASRQFQHFSWREWMHQVWASPGVRWFVGVALFLVVAWGVRWWRRRLRYPRSAKAVYTLATQLYLEATRLLQRKGISRKQSETPAEFVKRLQREFSPVAVPLSQVTNHYLELRFNPRSDQAMFHLEQLREGLEHLKVSLSSKSTEPTSSSR